jgi:hypothetical protein
MQYAYRAVFVASLFLFNCWLEFNETVRTINTKRRCACPCHVLVKPFNTVMALDITLFI